MKKCKYCNIKVDTDKSFCPICYNRLDKIDDDCEVFYTQHTVNETTTKPTNYTPKVFLFLSICTMFLCFIMNTRDAESVTWWPIVTFAIIYLWVLIKHTIFSSASPISKVFLQVVTLLLLFFFSERLSLEKWLVPYVYPSIVLIASVILLITSILSPKRNEYVFSFLLFTAILGAISGIFMFTHNDEFTLLNLISLSVTATICFGYMSFGYNAIKAELTRKWHL